MEGIPNFIEAGSEMVVICYNKASDKMMTMGTEKGEDFMRCNPNILVQFGAFVAGKS